MKDARLKFSQFLSFFFSFRLRAGDSDSDSGGPVTVMRKEVKKSPKFGREIILQTRCRVGCDDVYGTILLSKAISIAFIYTCKCMYV